MQSPSAIGLRSETQLADLAGCRFAFDAASRQWLPSDDEGRASRCAGVYLAGDGAGIAGADAAELAGERAALALLADRGHAASAARSRRELERKLAPHRGASATGSTPHFPFPPIWRASLPDETIVCRCEAVTAGELRATSARIDASEMNRAKAFTRVGMGRCQGRVCGGPRRRSWRPRCGCELDERRPVARPAAGQAACRVALL